jgi:hypothetical protein
MFLANARFVSATAVVIGLVCVGTALPSGGQQPATRDASTAAKGKSEPDGRRVRELLKQRHQTLQEYVELLESRHEAAGGDIVQVIRAKELLVGAELELADSDQQRLAAREKAVDLAKRYEQVIAIRVESGGGPNFDPAELLTAKAHRLATEIAYERATAELARDR